jgi:hypothetical protein
MRRHMMNKYRMRRSIFKTKDFTEIGSPYKKEAGTLVRGFIALVLALLCRLALVLR